MSRLICMVAILVAVVGVAQASPIEVVEKEALLRAALQLDERFFWLWDSETTTQLLTTPEAPEPVGGSRLTSVQICGMAQFLAPRSEMLETKRDIIVNLIHHICLPSVGPTDLDAVKLILDFLRGEEGDVEAAVATTPEPEEEGTLSPLWQKLKDNLANAQGNY